MMRQHSDSDMMMMTPTHDACHHARLLSRVIELLLQAIDGREEI